jgi:hypothetical protein
MIEFINYPPQSPDDIRFTEAAEESMHQHAAMVSGDIDKTTLLYGAYGEAVGRMLASSMVSTTLHETRPYVEALSEQVSDNVDSFTGEKFRDGMNYAFSSEQQSRRSNAV